MISAATGAMALLMVTLVKARYWYLFAATILTGILQIIAGWIRLGELMRFVSRSVVTGFVNALAILIFMAQLPELIDVPYAVYVMAAAGLGIILASYYAGGAVSSGGDCVAHGGVDLFWYRRPYGGRYGRSALNTPVLILISRSTWRRWNHLSLRGDINGRGSARITDDCHHRRRPNRHHQ